MYWKLLYCWCCSLSVLFAQPDYTSGSAYRQLAEGAPAFLLRDDVPLLAAPSVAAVALARGQMGEQVQVLARMDEQYQQQGFRTNWYAVSYRGQEAYVWGGHLAALYQVPPDDPSLQVLCGIEQVDWVNRGTYEEEQLVLTLSLCRGGKVLAQTTFPAVGTLYTQLQLRLRADHQLQGVRYVIEVQYSDGYCGGVSATQTLFWTGQQLYPIGLLSNGFSDRQFDRSYYRYPDEHAHGADVVLLQQEAGIYTTQHHPQYTHQKEQRYRWTGQALLPIVP